MNHYIIFLLFIITNGLNIKINPFNRPFIFKDLWKSVDSTSFKIIMRKSQKIYNNNNITQFNKLYKNDKVILLTPGGIDGFYMLGTISYIQETYELNKYIYSGASAGAWNALILSYNKDQKKFKNELLTKKDIFKYEDLSKTQHKIKKYIINNYDSNDFNFTKLFIGVTQFSNCKFQTNIYSDFYSLEDAINCCMASSHIPFITNGLLFKYANYLTFDGGLSSNPYIPTNNIPFIIKPDMWNRTLNSLFFPENTNLTSLYEKGYYDSQEHYSELDKFFKL